MNAETPKEMTTERKLFLYLSAQDSIWTDSELNDIIEICREGLRRPSTIEALEKSHAELLALISDIHNDAANCLSGEHIELAKAAIANAQPVVTMLREGRG